jgi:hypothetical protein
MPTTYVDYTATAAQTDFAFTFPYLEDEHVVVEIDGVQKTLTTDYTIVTSPSTKIVLTSGATAGQVVRVRRKSQPGTDLVDFENGSVLTESELDRAYLHNRYLNEEIGELNDASLQKEAGGTDWDAGGSKIKNVGTPTLTADATTKQYVDDKVNQVSSGASAPPTKWVFTGTAGANTTYSVTDAEVNGDTAYDVSIDGSVIEPTTDYTVNPDTDTLTIVSTLSGGEDIVVIERGFGVAITGTIGADQLQSNAVTTAKLADHSVTAVKISNTDSKFNVQTDGKVGIGTTSPNTKLSVFSASAASSVMRVARSTSPANQSSYLFNITEESDSHSTLDMQAANGISAIRMRTSGDTYFNGGNVGIGTDSPAAKLEVNAGSIGTDVHTIRMDSDSGGAYNIICSNASIEQPTWRHQTGIGEDLQFITSGSSNTNLHIDSNGSVGIGTGSPSAPLEVSSTTGGVVFPRLTTTQRDAISSPTDGETIFNSTTNQLESYNGTSWGAAGSGGVSKYDSGWVTTDGTTTVANSATLTFTHGLSTSAINAQLWVSGASDGSNPYLMDIQDSFQDTNMVGAGITNITSTQVTIQFGNSGYIYMNSSGQNATTTTNGHNAAATGFVPFTSKYIRVVAIG